MTVNAEEKTAESAASEAKSNKSGSEDREITELKKDIKHREQLKEALKENELLKISAEKEKKELLDKAAILDSTAKAMKEKYVLAELKAQAAAAGLSDLDFIKMMDSSSLIVGEDGNVQGVAEVVSAFKTAKPYLFGAEKKSSSSSNAGTPAGSAVKKVDALSIPKEDQAAALKNALANPHMFNS